MVIYPCFHFKKPRLIYYKFKKIVTHTPNNLVPIKTGYFSAFETIQITIKSNIPERFSQLCVGDEVNLEGQYKCLSHL